MPDFDLVVRGGLVVDGSGGAPFEADVGVSGDRIAAVGKVTGSGAEEIDARGKLVTPGFVDIHTHYDGQATWENRMAPSSDHGVTTVLAGNCGVGFAPCRPQDHEKLIALMEGVEDIPEAVMAAGVPWNWETFPQYLDALDQRRLDVDMGVQIPHSPLRVYVMGQRGVDREPSTEDERAQMRRLTCEAIQAGALGVSTSRNLSHRYKNGVPVASIDAAAEELLAMAAGLRDAGAGVFQIIPDLLEADMDGEFDLIERIARTSQRPLSFTLILTHSKPEQTQTALARLDGARWEGLPIKAQVYPRPVGFMLGLDLTLNPFSLKPSYRPLEGLSVAEKAAALRDPEMRARLLSEESSDPNPLLMLLVSRIGELYALGDPPDYAPPAERSVAAIAARRGVSEAEAAYDLMLENDGHALLYRAGSNFLDGRLDVARTMLAHPDSVIALGDGGAHYGMICDASYPTFMLTHWTRDARDVEGFDLPWTVQALTRTPALAIGLADRGLVAAGLKADLNVIDYDRLELHAPRMKRDLPSGGKRLTQTARGYSASILSGQVTYRDGAPTDRLPGRLLRGARSDPRPA